MNDRAGYIADPMRPAGKGWCEAILAAPGARHCSNPARFERDGFGVCGLHVKSKVLVTWRTGL